MQKVDQNPTQITSLNTYNIIFIVPDYQTCYFLWSERIILLNYYSAKNNHFNIIIASLLSLNENYPTVGRYFVGGSLIFHPQERNNINSIHAAELKSWISITLKRISKTFEGYIVFTIF